MYNICFFLWNLEKYSLLFSTKITPQSIENWVNNNTYMYIYKRPIIVPVSYLENWDSRHEILPNYPWGHVWLLFEAFPLCDDHVQSPENGPWHESYSSELIKEDEAKCTKFHRIVKVEFYMLVVYGNCTFINIAFSPYCLLFLFLLKRVMHVTIGNKTKPFKFFETWTESNPTTNHLNQNCLKLNHYKKSKPLKP